MLSPKEARIGYCNHIRVSILHWNIPPRPPMWMSIPYSNPRLILSPTPSPCFLPPPPSLRTTTTITNLLEPNNASGSRGNGRGDFAVSSMHSSARILKSNRRTPYDSNYSDKEEKADDDDKTDSDEEENDEVYLDGPLGAGHLDANLRTYQKSFRPYSRNEQSILMLNREDHLEKPSKNIGGGKFSFSYNSKNGGNREGGITGRSTKINSIDADGKLINGKSIQDQFPKLWEDLDFDDKWLPLIEYLSTFGMKESDFISIYERHMQCLQINVVSARERLDFLLGIGVKQRDIRKILVRQPQILEYTVENNLKSHVAFLRNIGVPEPRIGQIICAAPSLFSYSIELSLKPTINYLIEEVGIKPADVSKVVQLSPQILVQRIDSSWNSRFLFLSKELGAPRDSIVKMVTKHPQLLHYSIEDGIQPRINFLRSIGMRNSEILKVLTNLSQVLSLSLEGNLKPKYLYLVNELRNEVHSLAKYPMYLSLSLDQRIRPRHRFLVSLKKAPRGPFPLSSFVPTDECFCQRWAGTSLDKYLAFRQSLLLNDFAKKYERK